MFDRLKLIAANWHLLLFAAIGLVGAYFYVDHGGYERADNEWKAKYSAGLAQAKQDWIDRQASIIQAAMPQNDAITKAVANLNGAAAKLRTTYATTGKPLAADCLLDPERVQLANTFLQIH